LHGSRAPRDLPSFPTRRSSDLGTCAALRFVYKQGCGEGGARIAVTSPSPGEEPCRPDPTDWPWPSAVASSSPCSRSRRPRSKRRSEEHTSELQSRENLVCRLLL